MLKITKFGGSSCASAEQFRKVKAIIEANPSRRFVVISAAGRKTPKDNKLTDLLYLCRAHIEYHVDCQPVFDLIKGRLLEIKNELGLDTPIEEELSRFREALPDLTIDDIASRGEYFTSRLMADFLGFPFVDAKDVVAMEFDIVPNPKNIEKITYAELRELSYMGASVLHEDAIFPIREYNIPIHVLNTNRPRDPGTLVLDKISDRDTGPLVTGIAGKKGFLSIEIVKRNMSTMVGIVSGALDVLNKYGVSIEHLPSGIDSFNVVVNKKDVEHNLYEILSEIKQAIAPDSIRVPEPIALIAVVGRNMNARVGSSAKLFGALAEANVNIRMISQGSSEIDIIVGVSQQDFSKAVQALYNTFTK